MCHFLLWFILNNNFILLTGIKGIASVASLVIRNGNVLQFRMKNTNSLIWCWLRVFFDMHWIFSKAFRLPSFPYESSIAADLFNTYCMSWIRTEDSRRLQMLEASLLGRIADQHYILSLLLLLQLFSQNASLESRVSYGNWPVGLVCPWRKGRLHLTGPTL